MPTATAATKADLVINDITFSPNPPVSGQDVDITCKYANGGGSSTGSGFDVKITVDGDAKSTTASALSAGGSSQRTIAFGSKSAGSHTVKCEVNTNRAVVESNYDNSGWSTTKTWSSQVNPTLSSHDVAPKTFSAGDTLTGTYTIKNPRGSSVTAWLGMSIRDASGNVFSDTSGDKSVTVSASSTKTVTRSFAVPSSVSSGSYSYVLAIWPDQFQTSPWDSSGWQSGLTLNPKLADLVINDITFNPDPPREWESVDITCKYANGGQAGTGSGFDVKLTVDGDAKSTTASALSAGGSGQRTLTFGSKSAGSHNVKCEVNGNRAVTESNYDNSGWSTSKPWGAQANPTLPGHDVAPKTFSAGDTLTGTYTITNPRGSSVTAWLGMSLRDSSGNVISDTSGDKSVTVAASSTQTFTRSFKVPASASVGSYSYALAIWPDQFQTSPWASSGWQSGLTLDQKLADLVINDITFSPDPPREGESVDITCKYANGGQAGTGSGFEVKVTVGGDAKTTSASALSAGGSGQRVLAFGSKNAGSHTVKCEVNANRAVTESNYDNSGWTTTKSWAAQGNPTLAGHDVAPKAFTAGDTLTGTYTIRNPRGNSVTAWLGMSLRDPNGNVLSDTSGDKSVTVAAGSTQTFTRSFKLPANAPSGAYSYVLAIWPDQFQTSPWASSDWQGGLDLRLPDLVIHDITFSPDPPREGEGVDVTCKYANGGQVGTGSTFDVRITVDGETKSTTASALAANAADHRTLSFGSKAAGPHTVKCEVNANRAVRENNHDNSGWTKTPTPTWSSRADPTLQGHDVAPKTFSAGDTLTGTYTIKNPRGSSVTAWLGMSIRDASGNVFSDTSGDKSVTVAAASTQTFTRPFKVPTSASGGSYSYVLAIWPDQFQTSPWASTGWQTGLSLDEKLPDLVIHDITFDPDPPEAEKSVAITCKYANGGQAGTGSGFDVRISVDGEARSATASALAAGAADKRTITFEGKSAGPHAVKCEVNTNHAVRESNPDNSGWTRTPTPSWVSPAAPSLPSHDVAPRTIPPGGTLSATYSIRNPRSSGVSVWLGMSLRDSAGSVLSDPANDRSVTVAAGSTQTFTRSFSVPSTAAPGAYDYALAIWPDQFQTSPWASTGWQPGITVTSSGRPDLVIQNVTLDPDPPVAGQDVRVTCRYANGGDAGTSSGFDVKITIDGDAKSATADALGPGARGARTLAFGSYAPGPHDVKCEVNTDRAVAESNHANSGWTKAPTPKWIEPGDPTLQSHGVVPTNFSAGDTLTATYVIANPRGASVTAWLGMSLRGPDGAVLDDPTNDRSVTLPPSSTQTHTRSFKVPASAPPGAYSYVLAVWPDAFQTRPWSSSGWQPGLSLDAKQADLVIHGIALDPDPPREGEDVRVTCRYGNAGQASTGAGFDVRISVDGESKSALATALDAGAADQRTLTFGGRNAGPHVVKCETNTDRTITESNHDNSGWTKTPTPSWISSSVPTLTGGDVSQRTARAGDVLTATYTVQNPRPERLTAWIGMSVKGPDGRVHDDPLGDTSVELPASGNATFTRTFRLPGGIPTGEYQYKLAVWPDKFQTKPWTESAWTPGLRLESSAVTFRDDFDSLDASRWLVEGGPASPSCAGTPCLDPGHAAATGGRLELRIDPTTLSGAQLRTRDAFRYGTFEIRAKVSGVDGGWFAFFTYACPPGQELDFLETATGTKHGGGRSFDVVAWNGANCKTQTDSRTGIRLPSPSTDYHTYRFEWAPGRLDAYVDEFTKPVATLTQGIADAPQPLLVSLWAPGWLLDETGRPTKEVTATVDYVEVRARERIIGPADSPLQPPALLDQALATTAAGPGETLTARFHVENLRGAPTTTCLAASLRSSKGRVDLDPVGERCTSIAPGRRWIEQGFRLPSDLAASEHEYMLALWPGQPQPGGHPWSTSGWRPGPRVQDPVSLAVVDVTPATVAPGEQLTATLRVTNPRSTAIAAWIGMSLKGPDGKVLDDPTGDLRVTVPASSTKDFTRAFRVPKDAAPGAYQHVLAAWPDQFQTKPWSSTGWRPGPAVKVASPPLRTPRIEITSFDPPETAEIGAATIRLVARLDGANAAGGALALGFPGLTDLASVLKVEGGSSVLVGPGTKPFPCASGSCPASYVHVVIETGAWTAGTERTLTVRVALPKPGSFAVDASAVARTDPEVFAPDPAPVDEIGLRAVRKTIQVRANADTLRWDAPTHAKPGDTVTLRYTARDPDFSGEVRLEVWGGERDVVLDIIGTGTLLETLVRLQARDLVRQSEMVLSPLTTDLRVRVERGEGSVSWQLPSTFEFREPSPHLVFVAIAAANPSVQTAGLKADYSAVKPAISSFKWEKAGYVGGETATLILRSSHMRGHRATVTIQRYDALVSPSIPLPTFTDRFSVDIQEDEQRILWQLPSSVSGLGTMSACIEVGFAGWKKSSCTASSVGWGSAAPGLSGEVKGVVPIAGQHVRPSSVTYAWDYDGPRALDARYVVYQRSVGGIEAPACSTTDHVMSCRSSSVTPVGHYEWSVRASVDDQEVGRSAWVPFEVSNVANPRRVVVLHGWRGDGESAGAIAAALRDAGVSPVVLNVTGAPFEYRPHSRNEGVEDLARRVGGYLTQALADDGGMSDKRIDIVGHSMGGLVARTLVTRLGWADRVATVVYVATPNQGAIIKDLDCYSSIGKWHGNARLCLEMVVGSTFLKTLPTAASGVAFYSVGLERRWPSPADLEYRDLDGDGIPLGNDEVVYTEGPWLPGAPFAWTTGLHLATRIGKNEEAIGLVTEFLLAGGSKP